MIMAKEVREMYRVQVASVGSVRPWQFKKKARKLIVW